MFPSLQQASFPLPGAKYFCTWSSWRGIDLTTLALLDLLTWVWLRNEISENKALCRVKKPEQPVFSWAKYKKVDMFISGDPVHLWSIYSSLILWHHSHILLKSKYDLKTALLCHKSDICSSFGLIPIFMFMKLERSWNACISSFQLSLLNVLTRSQVK